ncbi:Flagellin protein FlaA [Acidisarcina polymorpha]|uniref:Flagellin n=1 Tax=Acidisarcina polymorpha TaxID=2211140 RepID=A0A2Z5G8F7_9BACT|nr:flagellin [Acidisarcina polymorpha]AXC14836.1 Flagellin protein FlaA [Acidisarcina polymorpha]
MSLGVLNNISAIYAQNNLSTTQANLQKTLEQLSSGSRINSGADDPAGLSISNGLAANEAALTQSSQNATSGVGLLQVADGALSQVNSLLNRAITLATEAGNGTLDSAQGAAAQQEYGDILSEINTIGSSTEFNGNAVFSSAQSNIFTSDGTTTGTNSYNVGVGTLSTTSGVGVTAPGTSSGTGSTASLAPLLTKAGAAAATYTAAVKSVSTLTLTGTLASTDNVIGTLQLYAGSTAYTINTGTTGETVAALDAQIAADTGGTTAVGGAAITITAGTAGVANAIVLGTSTLEDTTAGAVTASSGALAAANGTAGADTVNYAASASQTYSINAHSAADTFTNSGLSVTFGTGANAVTTNVIFTGTGGIDTLAQLDANIVTAAASAGAGTIAATVTGNNVAYTASASGSAADFTINGGVNDILASSASSSGSPSAGATLSGTSLSTSTGAASALTAIYNAINDVSYQRGAVGANINTLTAVSEVESTQNVNVTAAQNSISATDYGQATSNLSKYEILSQTGISALAQTNSVQQEVLKLLQ